MERAASSLANDDSLAQRSASIRVRRDNLSRTMGRDQLFVSYSHKDKKWLEVLQTHLKPFVKEGLDVWADTRIEPGSEWKKEVAKALDRAKVAVLLVSPNFLASDFISDNELPQLLEAAKQHGLRILWIAVSHSAVSTTQITKFQAAHDPSVPLDRRAKPGLNKEMVSICENIRTAMSASPPPPVAQSSATVDALVHHLEDPSIGDTFRPGASGAAIKNLKTALDWIGYRQLWRNDQEYDAQLVEAVLQFQAAAGHRNQDGCVGPGTRRLIVERLIAKGFDFKRFASVEGRRG
jgi:murein L,D-transpeptidase YcbB/YkuD